MDAGVRGGSCQDGLAMRACRECDLFRGNSCHGSEQLPQAGVGHREASCVPGKVEARRAGALFIGQQLLQLLELRRIDVEGKALQRAAGRPALPNRKLPGRAGGKGWRQRPNPEARRGSSGALSLSLL
jgi:hypothetical protein